MTAACPECGTQVNVPDDCMVEEVIECDECAVELQVTSKSPLALAVYEEAEK
jgi:alpha-aminoadipate carrier protein LysW